MPIFNCPKAVPSIVKAVVDRSVISVGGMMRFWIVCVMVSLGWSWSIQSSHASTRTSVHFAIIVGNNKGVTTDQPLRYSHSDARRLRRLLSELGGFKPQNSFILVEQDASKLQQLWLRVERKIHQLKRLSPQPKVTLLFYYSGHADHTALHLGRSKLPFQRLRRWLRNSSATVRLAFLDTCRSGQLLGTKGARRTKRRMRLPPRIRHSATSGMAMITSSGEGEDSHEQDQLRGSIFTHYLLSGLRGAADNNHDSQVSLHELYSYVYRRTISHTVFLSHSVQHPSFRNELRGHGHLVLTRLQRASARLNLQTTASGVYYVLNEKRTQLVAEINKRRGQRVSIGLPPGRYIVVHRSPSNYRVQNLNLHKGQRHKLQPRQMLKLTYLASAAKGLSWLTHPKAPQRYHPSNYRSAFYASLGVALTTLVSTGIFFGLSAKYLNDARDATYGGVNGRRQAQGIPATDLASASQGFNVGALVSLSLAVGASTSATVFYLLHRKQAAQFQTLPLKKNLKHTSQAKFEILQ